MIQIFINDEEIVCESNFEIQEEFMNVSHIELYKVYPKSWKGTNRLLTDYYFPDDYSKCNIYDDTQLIFSGLAKNSADMELDPFKPHYCSLQIFDYSTLLSEGDLLNFVIYEKTVEEAIEQVINAISNYGFAKGEILIPPEQNTVISSYSTSEKAPYDVFQYLSLISGTRWGTRMIDENTTAIDFFSPELLEKKGTIECTKSYYTQNRIEKCTYDYSTTNYRNKQIITSDEVYANIKQKELLLSNGYDTTFLVEQKIGRIISISLNDVPKNFATMDEKEIGITADFYYKVSESQFTSKDTLAQGNKIIIEYIPIVKGREIVVDTSESSRINNITGRNGIIARYENRNDVTSSSELQAIGKTCIKYYGKPELSLKIISREDFLQLGGKYHFNAPIEKLDVDFLVKSKKTRILYNTELYLKVYEYELTNTFDLENDINYFDNQRAKATGNISVGEYIARNIDVENTINIIFNNLQIEELEIDVENVLENELEIILGG